MPGSSFFLALSPFARVIIALAPFALAIALRLGFGRTRMTEILLTIATSWFVVNILIAPYSVEMKRDLHQMLHH